jgi:hypothetical protein
MGKNGELDRAVRSGKKLSANTPGYALAHANARALASYNAELIQKARRNKVHANGTLFGWRVCVMDGYRSPLEQAIMREGFCLVA